MAHYEIGLNEVRDPALSVRLEHEIGEAVEPVLDPDEGVIGFTIFDEGRHVDIQMEHLGWVERRAVPASPRPGDVRRLVEQFLTNVGLR